MAGVLRLPSATAYAVILWVVLCFTATAVAQTNVAGGASTSSYGSSPVERVVQLLRNLEAQLQQDDARSDAIYTKYHSWCVDSAKDLELTMSNDDSGQVRMQSLVSEEAIHARRERRDLIQAVTKLQQRQQSLQQAAAIRSVERQAYLKFSDSFERQRNQLEIAAEAFESPAQDGLPTAPGMDVQTMAVAVSQTLQMSPQLMASVTPEEQQALDRLASAPSSASTTALRGGSPLSKASAASLLQQKQRARQAAASLARGMLVKLRSDADVANEDEKRKQQAFEQLARSTSLELQNEKASLDTRQSIADSRQMIAGSWDAELNIAKDAKPHGMTELRALATACKSQAHGQEVRKKIQSAELAVVGKAISLLTGIQEPVLLSSPRGVRASLSSKNVFSSFLTPSPLLPVQIAQVPVASSSFVFLQVGQESTHGYVRKSDATIFLQGKQLVAAMLQRAGIGKAGLGYDPLAKVKQMVQKMLEHLLSEAAQEMEHHAWCIGELSKSKLLREEAERTIREADRQTGALEAVKQNIVDEVKQLQQDEAEVAKQLAAATGVRGYENQQALLAIGQYSNAKDLVLNAVEVLESFYKQQDAASMPQGPREEDDYDGGMSLLGTGDGPQTPAASSIINLLQTAASDYERLSSEAAAEEKRAQSDYEAMAQESKERQKLLKEGFTVRKKSLDVVTTSITRGYQEVNIHKDNLAKLKAYEEELKENCNQAGSSEYDRRMEKEDEVRRLQAALKVLNDKTPTE